MSNSELTSSLQFCIVPTAQSVWLQSIVIARSSTGPYQSCSLHDRVCGVIHHSAGHEEMTIEEIMLGKGDYYPGLIPLVYAYLGHIGCDSDTMDTVDQVIKRRCFDVLPSCANAKLCRIWCTFYKGVS